MFTKIFFSTTTSCRISLEAIPHIRCCTVLTPRDVGCHENQNTGQSNCVKTHSVTVRVLLIRDY